MWRAYLIEIMTGRVGAEVEMSTDGRLDITLNQAGSATVTVQKSSLEGIPSRWFRPWAHGFLLTLEVQGDEVPVFAGPITAPPDEYVESLSFSVSGIRAIFEYRIALAEDFSSSEINALRKSKLVYKDISLAGIAQDLVRKGMAKRGGSLPIRIVTPPGPGNHARTYDGYDVQNNNIDKRLSELSDVIGGPDIMFYPEWVDGSRQLIRWAMRTGTPGYAAISQSWTMVIDAGAPEPQVSELSMNVDGSHYGTRAYTTGTGQGAGLLVRIHDAVGLLEDSHPLLETVTSYPSVSRGETLSDYARTHTSIRPRVELHATIDITDVRSPYGQWLVGHNAIVKPGPWHTIHDVEKPLRILRMAGDLDSPHMTLYFQEEPAW